MFFAAVDPAGAVAKLIKGRTMLNRFLIGPAVAVLVMSIPALAQTKAASYVPAAGASDLYEKTSSELVLMDARTPAVRAFAQMMIADHAKTTAKIKAAATSAGIKVSPPMLMPKQQAMIDELKSAAPAAREKLYLKQQVTAHQEALALHKGYAASGDVPALKTVAAGAVPIVQHHLSDVQKLAGK
jgi:putative membrane protein